MGVVSGDARVCDGRVAIGDEVVGLTRGTAALIAAAAVVCEWFGLPAPRCVVGGDIGDGQGSTALYRTLRDYLPEVKPQVAALHYIMPNVYHHEEVMQAIGSMVQKPMLIADAGFMYVAKMAGYAPFYEVFTPDLGELAFLADGEAPHPFYTRGFIVHQEDQAETLIKMAYQEECAAKYLLVKGKCDYICEGGKVVSTVTEPQVPELEAIGGTGDTITGMAAALMFQGRPTMEALRFAALANRLAGKQVELTPATQITEIIAKIPGALREVMSTSGNGTECRSDG